jgi:Holliday junction resolvase RusA-like endonuclease
MVMITVELPWMPSVLRPNRARTRHWAANGKAAAAYKAECLIELRRQGLGKIDADQVAITLRFHPPRRGRMDRSGSLAAFKAAEDALADVIGIDDDQFEPITLCRGDPVPGGKVVVTIHDMEGF